MKYNKTLLLALLLPLSMTGCDKDDEVKINSSEATIQFENSELKLKENTRFLLMPLVIQSEGVRDGDIFVHVTMKENNAEFELDKEVILTTETLRIPAEVNTINFETALDLENEEITKGRNITFEITKADGASVGTNSTCKINILEKIFAEGTYTIRGVNPFDDSMSTGICRLASKDESIDNMVIDFFVGGSVDVKFTEVVPDFEYDIEIPGFKSIGSYQGANVILSWAYLDKGKNEVQYDKEKPIKGKFVRKIEKGKESIAITFSDGFGLIEDRGDGKYLWFYNVWIETPTMEKNQ